MTFNLFSLVDRVNHHINHILSYTNSKTTVKNTIASLHSDPKDQTSNLIDNSREKANILNSYFASVYTKEPPDEIPKLAHRKAPGLGSSTVDQVLKYHKYIPSTSTGQVLIF